MSSTGSAVTNSVLGNKLVYKYLYMCKADSLKFAIYILKKHLPVFTCTLHFQIPNLSSIRWNIKQYFLNGTDNFKKSLFYTML